MACWPIKSSIIINWLILNCIILKEAWKRPNKILKIQNTNYYTIRYDQRITQIYHINEAVKYVFALISGAVLLRDYSIGNIFQD